MAPKEYDMETSFYHLMDNLEELLPETPSKLDDDCLICECFCVSVKDIRDLRLETLEFEVLKEKLSLGEGCQSCLKRKEDWINKII
jgi:NAD(P)H-nitrite reductase large subunit